VKSGVCDGEWGNGISVIGFGADVAWGVVVDGVVGHTPRVLMQGRKKTDS
jgi:hypothetical protein